VKERIARWALDQEFIEARDMFGVTTFLYRGNFFAADDGGHLVLRLSEADEAEARKIPGSKPWNTGGPGTNVYTRILASQLPGDAALGEWLDKALAHAKTLEPKERLVTKQPKRPDWMDA